MNGRHFDKNSFSPTPHKHTSQCIRCHFIYPTRYLFFSFFFQNLVKNNKITCLWRILFSSNSCFIQSENNFRPIFSFFFFVCYVVLSNNRLCLFMNKMLSFASLYWTKYVSHFNLAEIMSFLWSFNKEFEQESQYQKWVFVKNVKHNLEGKLTTW